MLPHMIDVADHTFYLTQSQYTDTGLTSPSADTITAGAWQSSHWSANFQDTGMTQPGKIPTQVGIKPRICRSWGLTTEPTRRSNSFDKHVQFGEMASNYLDPVQAKYVKQNMKNIVAVSCFISLLHRPDVSLTYDFSTLLLQLYSAKIPWGHCTAEIFV